MTREEIEDQHLARYRANPIDQPNPNARRAMAREIAALEVRGVERDAELAALRAARTHTAPSAPSADDRLAAKFGFAPGAFALADEIAGVGLDGSVTLKSGQKLTREQARALFAGGGAR